MQGYDASFGASADGAAKIGSCGCFATAGEYEVVHCWQFFFERVYGLLKCLYACCAYCGIAALFAGKVATNVKQGVFCFFNYGLLAGVQVGGEQSEACVKFVDGAVCFHARVVFGNACASYEGGFSAVASSGVYCSFFHTLHF